MTRNRQRKRSHVLPPPGEFGYIDWMRPQCATHPLVRIPSGDDCAALAVPRGQELLYAIDSVIDGIHFLRRKHGCYAGARKAVLRNLSDIASMGGTPLAVVVAGGLPDRFSAREKAQLFAGLNDTCRRWKTALVGGDVARSGGALWLAVSILGLAPAGAALTRGGASPGEAIYVTGRLGGSIHGRHLDFTPRLAEGEFLRRHKFATACLDLSDGLARDLTHLCAASQVGATVELARLPVAAAVLHGRRRPTLNDCRHALGDGEDYELVFTVRPRDEVRLLKRWPRRLAPLTRVGCTTHRREGLRAVDSAGQVIDLRGWGWEHTV